LQASMLHKNSEMMKLNMKKYKMRQRRITRGAVTINQSLDYRNVEKMHPYTSTICLAYQRRSTDAPSGCASE
jgi:hypothetical protein